MDYARLVALAEQSAQDNLRNRNISAENANAFQCRTDGCDSTLTITDGSRCRQCILQERMK